MLKIRTFIIQYMGSRAIALVVQTSINAFLARAAHLGVLPRVRVYRLITAYFIVAQPDLMLVQIYGGEYLERYFIRAHHMGSVHPLQLKPC